MAARQLHSHRTGFLGRRELPSGEFTIDPQAANVGSGDLGRQIEAKRFASGVLQLVGRLMLCGAVGLVTRLQISAIRPGVHGTRRCRRCGTTPQHALPPPRRGERFGPDRSGRHLAPSAGDRAGAVPGESERVADCRSATVRRSVRGSTEHLAGCRPRAWRPGRARSLQRDLRAASFPTSGASGGRP